MRFTLKDFQEDAVREVMARLERCRTDWHAHHDRNSFALSSVTGSGKTVIASTVIEALLHGSTEFDVDPDPGAVILWVTKDPTLNEQTKSRIIESADRVPVGNLVVLGNDFAEDRLLPGNVYFINTGKLGKDKLLVRKSNTRSVTFWEILDNTISDPNATLYLILDEAHEGMKRQSKDAEEEETVVRKIINGHDGSAAVPIVWGISATVKRFTDAMAAAEDRSTKPNVVIDPKQVQASGLLKNTLALEIPNEKGDFETSLVRDAAVEFGNVCDRWRDYCTQEGIDEPVLPLLVVQIPNKSDDERGAREEEALIVRVLDTIRSAWSGYTEGCVAHVIGEHGDLEVGSYSVPKIKPQDVEADTRVRILLAKDAISTGWDCPRAEVLVSLRPGKDDTYVTQLLGRMVRTPLARSTSDDILNSASCFLPHFDRKTAKNVAEQIMGIKPLRAGETPEPLGPRVLLAPVDLAWNDEVPEEVKTLLESLPSLPKPSASPKPLKRLLALAAALAQDELVKDADSKAKDRLYAVLDGLMAEHATTVDDYAKAIMTADIRRIIAERGDEEAIEGFLQRDADANTVKDAFRATKRLLSPAVANGYLRRLYQQAIRDDLHANLVRIQARVAALIYVVDSSGEGHAIRKVEDSADSLTKHLLSAHHADIALLNEKRRAVYDEVRAQSRDPEQVDTEVPVALRVDTVNDDRELLEAVPKHVLADADGLFPVATAFNSWEVRVIKQETARSALVGWYRNPSSAGRNSLRIPYKKEGEWKSMQPDFILVERNADGELVPAIVDPHGTHLTDALPKLHGLADYAEEHGAKFSRIDSLAEAKDGVLKVLNMKDQSVRRAVRMARTAEELFNGPLAHNY